MEEHKLDRLPFQVGEMAESRSFISGFRGAWFRSKIKEIGWKQDHMGHALEYVDFPDEKIKWIRIYQKPPIHKTKSNEIKRELMVRPPFPRVYRESQMPPFDTISEETVIVDDVRKVGDLVDWFTDGCYWSGTVTRLLSDDKVTIQLLDPPYGEGLSYDVCCKDLRPSLEWSPERGWTVPIAKEGESHHCCAQLFQPVKYDKISYTEDCGIGKTSCSDSVSSSLFRDAPDSMAGNTGKDEYCNDGFSKMRSRGSIPLNSERSDTLEAAIMDLEELANKVRWLKGILKSGTPSKSTRPSWKFVEHRATPPPK